MVPIAAFSLACNVIQVVDFSMKVLAKCKEFYDHGALSEHQETEGLTRHLTNLRIGVLPPQSLETTQAPEDRELLDLVKACSATAEQLVAKLQSLKIEGSHKKRQAVFKTLKAFREKRGIHDLEKRLDNHRSVLNTKILISLSQRSDLASFQQSHDFQTLDQGIKTLITTISVGPKSFEELRTVIGQENKATREHISNAFQKQQEQYEVKEFRKRLLKSLWFDEIHSREEKIDDNHRKTFEWIFDVSDHTMGPWDNFIQWLEKGQGTYWINGKAGSGKSTLMSFLCKDDRTLQHLRFWSGNRDKNVLMPKFYFWSGGTQMQKSIEGLLRSLIWQVLQLLPDLDITSNAFQSRDMIPAWTERRLQNTLRSLLHQASGSHLLCFFIDGLDEYEGDQPNLIRFIQVLVQSNTVKVCLSSRPDRVFNQAFGTSAKLRLQDLTHSDIQKVVVDRVRGMPQFQSMAAQRSDWLEIITHSILARADGVFLWVTLAVNDQIRGLENGDSLEQLEERLNSLPDEVEGIYARMLGQIEKVYRKEASIFLQMASRTECLSVLDFVLASQDRLEDMLSSSDPLPVRELIAKSHSVRQRIVTTCAGLLEVESHERFNPVRKHMFLKSETASVEPDDASSREDASSKPEDVSLKSESAALKPHNESNDASSIRNLESIGWQGEAIDDEIHALEVGFIHRTARDFMRDPAQGGNFLQANTFSDFHPQVSFVKVLLAKRLFGKEISSNEIMENIRLAEDATEVAQFGLCDLTDDVMSRIHRHLEPRPPDFHWVLREASGSWRSLHEDLVTLDYEASSPSNSNDSFQSVDSQPKTPNDLSMILFDSQPKTPNDLSMTIVKKPDFLAFAVYHNLRRYVQRVIHDRKEPLAADTLSYLLYCAVYSLYVTQHWLRSGRPDDLDLINEFLGQGGSPNMRDSARTTWSLYLGAMHDRFRWNIHKNELRRAYMQTTIAFVEKGADLQFTFTVSSHIGNAAKAYNFDLDLSTLAAMELCLNNQPEYSHLRDLCATKGASCYSRCPQITRAILSWEYGYVQRNEDLRLSDPESTAVLDFYKKFLANGPSRTKSEYELTRHLDDLFRDRIEDVKKYIY